MGIIGEAITNPMDLLNETSVYVKVWEKPKATAFLVSMQFRVLAGLIERGVYKYTPEVKTKKTFIDQVKWKPATN